MLLCILNGWRGVSTKAPVLRERTNNNNEQQIKTNEPIMGVHLLLGTASMFENDQGKNKQKKNK